MRKLFALFATLLLTQLAMANETVMYRCQPQKPTNDFKVVQIGYFDNFVYAITLIANSAGKSLRYKAEYSDDILYPEYFSTGHLTDIRIQFDETTKEGNLIEASYVKDGKYYEAIPLACQYLN